MGLILKGHFGVDTQTEESEKFSSIVLYSLIFSDFPEKISGVWRLVCNAL